MDDLSQPTWRALFDELADLVWPPVCAVCDTDDEGDGLGCAQHRLRLGLAGPRCGRCATAIAPSLPDGERCPACRGRAPGFDALVAACDYQATAGAREWLLAFKYRRRRDLASTLGRLLAVAWEASLARDDARWVLVPVPLHPLRRLERGYDQALLLARSAGLELGLPVVRALRRTRRTSVQGAPGAASRTANVSGAFAPARFAARRIGGRAVLLVDDVVTSGATAAECARELKRLGARRVVVLAAARA
jgi:ComF family protein